MGKPEQSDSTCPEMGPKLCVGKKEESLTKQANKGSEVALLPDEVLCAITDGQLSNGLHC